MLIELSERQIKILQSLAAARHAELGSSLALVNFDLPGGAAARVPIADAQQRLQGCIDALQNPVEEPPATVEDEGLGVRYVLGDADHAQAALSEIHRNFDLYLVRSALENVESVFNGPFLTGLDARDFIQGTQVPEGVIHRVAEKLHTPLNSIPR